jgi:hypothetical protein
VHAFAKTFAATATSMSTFVASRETIETLEKCSPPALRGTMLDINAVHLSRLQMFWLHPDIF